MAQENKFKPVTVKSDMTNQGQYKYITKYIATGYAGPELQQTIQNILDRYSCDNYRYCGNVQSNVSETILIFEKVIK